MKSNILQILLSLFIVIMFGACSTTKKLGEGEVLYIGVKHFTVNADNEEIKIPSGVKSDLFDVINVKPNSPLYSPYINSPIPIGLWVYNNIDVKSKKGLKNWIYNKFAEEPILISDVHPELRLNMLQDVLHKNGYFSSSESFNILYNKNNDKKARINYSIETGLPYTISEVRNIQKDSPITAFIDSLISINSYMKPESRYCLDSLNQVRADIANTLRNKGYYYFNPDYIEYLADSTITKGKIAIKVILSAKTPKKALRKYTTGKITTVINRNKGGGYPDTTFTDRGVVIQMKPSNLRKSLIPSCLTFNTGKTLSVRDMSRTQNYLSRLGIFNGISIDIQPQDTTNNNDILDVYITCTFDAPLEASLELNGAYKSNDYIGPGIAAGITHKNLFGGGEQLNTSLSSSYEWQLGKSSGNNADYNYYNIGLKSTLSFPRLLIPWINTKSRRNLNWTRVSVGATIFNYPDVVKVLQLNASFGYEWYFNRHSSHELSLFKLTFSKMLREPDYNEDANISALLLYHDVLIPQISYTYTLSHLFSRKTGNNILWKSTISESGGVIGGIWELVDPKSDKDNRNILGVPFAQFVKGQTQLVYSQHLGRDHWLVSRFLVGAILSYGSSTSPPYEEMFYIGGANSIRAFAARSIGPGSYKETDGYLSFLFQSGTFKLEFNVEYRFPIFGPLHGALFVDAGNVWLLKDETDLLPGSLLTGKHFFNDIALGTGVGLRFDISMLVVRADLGYALHAPYDTGVAHYFNMPFKKSFALNFAIGYPF